MWASISNCKIFSELIPETTSLRLFCAFLRFSAHSVLLHILATFALLPNVAPKALLPSANCRRKPGDKVFALALIAWLECKRSRGFPTESKAELEESRPEELAAGLRLAGEPRNASPRCSVPQSRRTSYREAAERQQAEGLRFCSAYLPASCRRHCRISDNSTYRHYCRGCHRRQQVVSASASRSLTAVGGPAGSAGRFVIAAHIRARADASRKAPASRETRRAACDRRCGELVLEGSPPGVRCFY